jgi:hypothetical protein
MPRVLGGASASSSWWAGAGAWMRFFVAKDAPQNDGGFCGAGDGAEAVAEPRLGRLVSAGGWGKSGGSACIRTSPCQKFRAERARVRRRTWWDRLLLCRHRRSGRCAFCRGRLRAEGWARRRSFVAEGAPQDDGGFCGAGDGAEAAAEPRLDYLSGAGGWGKAVAEPPHSKSSSRIACCLSNVLIVFFADGEIDDYRLAALDRDFLGPGYRRAVDRALHFDLRAHVQNFCFG